MGRVRTPKRAPIGTPGSKVIPEPLLGNEVPEMSSSVAATPTRASNQVADQLVREPTVASSPYRRQVPSPGPTALECDPTTSAPTAGISGASRRVKATSTVAAGSRRSRGGDGRIAGGEGLCATTAAGAGPGVGAAGSTTAGACAGVA